MPQSRQLAAIMFTDIVGYTALMGSDEQKAFQLLKKNRQIQQPLIKQYNGTWIKELGDGVLASFHTVTDAVLCSAAIHKACHAVDGLKLRIGIHLGEVVFENNDVFGDGVNIASRLQALAPIGGTFVSESVYKNISNKKEIITQYVREETLKNVREPVKIYEIKLNEGSQPGPLPDLKKRSAITKANKKRIIVVIAAFLVVGILVAYFLFINTQKESATASDATTDKSIAVLPFVNMSNDPQQEYFSDGLSEELINMLTRIPDLKVTGRTSSFAFKGKTEDLRNIGKKLGVSFLLEGSVRKSGNKIRIATQLIKATDGTHIWSETYNREINDIFEVQDQISISVTNALKVTLLSKDKLSSQFRTKPEAYNDFLQGRYIYESYNDPSNNERAVVWFKEALKKDSSFSLAWTYLSMIYWRQSFNANQAEFKEARRAALKALELDPTSGIAAVNVAEILDNEFDFQGALKKIELALKIEPDNPYVLRNAGRFFTLLGRKEESIALCKRSLQYDPIQRSALGYYILANYYAGNYKEGMDAQKKFDEAMLVTFTPLYRIYFEMLLQSNYLEKARKYVEKLTDPPLQLYELVVINAKAGNKKESDRALNQLTEKYTNWPYYIALAYTYIGEFEKAVDWLETAYINKDKSLVYVNVEPLFIKLRRNTRFSKLIQQMNFPK